MRKLKYPLYNQETNGNITDDAGLPLNEFIWPSDPEERTILPLYVSQREFTAILSAMDVGADIAYPEQYISVMWIMLRNLRYGVNICDMVASCIANSDNVQAQLRAFITNDESIRDFTERVVQQGAPVSPESNTALIVETEDLDALFGAVTYLVDTMNGANEDLYQAIEASSNNREGGQILFEAIPIFETLPLDEISEYVDFMVSSVAENYAAAYTTTPVTGLRDRIRCALFCMARDNGNSLSWQQIADYFWGEVNFTAGNYYEVISDFVEFVTTGSWSGEEIATISFANIASVLSNAQEFAGMTFPGLTAIMQLGLNDPDPDWETLCEDCPPPIEEGCYPFILTDQDFTPVIPNYAVWHNGEGWGKGSAHAGRIGIEREGLPAFNRVTVTFNADVDFCALHQMYYLGWGTVETINGPASSFVFDIDPPFTLTAVSIDSGDNDLVIGDGVRITEICIEMI